MALSTPKNGHEDSWVLGIDTSTKVCVGLARTVLAPRQNSSRSNQETEASAKETVRSAERVGQLAVGDSKSHAELLMPTIQQLLAENKLELNQISGIGVGVGPGPYTGLRVGIVTAQTIGFLLGIEPVGVISLDVLAKQFVDPTVSGLEDCANLVRARQDGFVICSDARRKELYWARYDRCGVRIGEPQVSSPKQLPDLPVAGPGTLVYPEILQKNLVSGLNELDGSVLAANISNFADAGIEPCYLRCPDAKVPGKPKSALPKLQFKPRRFH